jgi:hypothetical protein
MRRDSGAISENRKTHPDNAGASLSRDSLKVTGLFSELWTRTEFERPALMSKSGVERRSPASEWVETSAPPRVFQRGGTPHDISYGLDHDLGLFGCDHVPAIGLDEPAELGSGG